MYSPPQSALYLVYVLTTNNKRGAIEGIRPFMISSTNSHASAVDQQVGLLPTEDGHHT